MINFCSAGSTGPADFVCLSLPHTVCTLVPPVSNVLLPHVCTHRPGDVALMLPAQQKKAFGCAVEHVGREDVVLKVSTAAKEQW